MKAGGSGRSPRAACAASKHAGIKGEGLLGYSQLAGGDILDIERLQRLLDHDWSSRTAAVVVLSRASSTSIRGTAGGRAAPVCSLAPV